MESITESVLRYQDSGNGYEEIVRRISIIIYNFPSRTHNLTEEDKGEFYISFYNRIEGLINNFTYKGIPFDTLLNQTLKWHIKTYLAKRKNENKLMAVNIQEEEVKMKDFLSVDVHSKNIQTTDIKLKGKASRKRLLFLVLVDSPNITDDEMKTFADLTGYEFDWLLYLKDTLNKRLFKRNERLNKLREKRNNTYMKLLYKQSMLSDESEPDKKELLEDQIKKVKETIG